MVDDPHEHSALYALDVLERPALARPVCGEERQLPAPCVGAYQREGIRPVDHVHPEVPDDEIRY